MTMDHIEAEVTGLDRVSTAAQPVWSVRRDGSGWRAEGVGTCSGRLAWQPGLTESR